MSVRAQFKLPRYFFMSYSNSRRLAQRNVNAATVRAKISKLYAAKAVTQYNACRRTTGVVHSLTYGTMRITNDVAGLFVRR